jgi:hypothetical protein
MAPIFDGSRALTPGAYLVAAGKAESAAPGFFDFELREAKTRNFRFDQETFLGFAPAKSKSLNHDSTGLLFTERASYVRTVLIPGERAPAASRLGSPSNPRRTTDRDHLDPTS